MGNIKSSFRLPRGKQLPSNVLLIIAKHLIHKDISTHLLPIWQSCKLFNNAFYDLGKSAKLAHVFGNLCSNEGWRIKFYVAKCDVTKQFLQNCIMTKNQEAIYHDKHYEAMLFGYSNIWIENNEPIFLVFKDTQTKQSPKCIGNKIVIKCIQTPEGRRLYLYYNNLKQRINWLYFDKDVKNMTITILTYMQNGD